MKRMIFLLLAVCVGANSIADGAANAKGGTRKIKGAIPDAGVCLRGQPNIEAPYDYFDVLIDVLFHLRLGQNEIDAITNAQPGKNTVVSILVAAKKEMQHQVCSIQLLIPFTDSHGNIIAKSSRAIAGIIAQLNEISQNLYDESVHGIDHPQSSKKSRNLGALADREADRDVKIHNAWGRLMAAFAAVNWAALPADAANGTERPKLLINSAQRSQLLKKINEDFPEPLSRVDNQAIELSANYLRKFFTDNWKSADDK